MDKLNKIVEEAKALDTALKTFGLRLVILNSKEFEQFAQLQELITSNLENDAIFREVRSDMLQLAKKIERIRKNDFCHCIEVKNDVNCEKND